MFSLLFFEQGYLSNQLMITYKIFRDCSSGLFRGKHMDPRFYYISCRQIYFENIQKVTFCIYMKSKLSPKSKL